MDLAARRRRGSAAPDRACRRDAVAGVRAASAGGRLRTRWIMCAVASAPASRASRCWPTASRSAPRAWSRTISIAPGSDAVAGELVRPPRRARPRLCAAPGEGGGVCGAGVGGYHAVALHVVGGAALCGTGLDDRWRCARRRLRRGGDAAGFQSRRVRAAADPAIFGASHVRGCRCEPPLDGVAIHVPAAVHAFCGP